MTRDGPLWLVIVAVSTGASLGALVLAQQQGSVDSSRNAHREFVRWLFDWPRARLV